MAKKQWLAWQPGASGEWERAIDGADAVINLAGEPIAGKRWTPKQKEILRSSRVDGTKALVDAIAKATGQTEIDDQCIGSGLLRSPWR